MNSSISLPVTPRAAATARQTIEAALGPHAHAELVENAKLLATELVTNAVRHAGLSPSEWIEFHVDATPLQVRVEVCDRGAGFRQRWRRSGVDGGWGLYLVEQLSTRWGIEQDGVTRVWFELASR